MAAGSALKKITTRAKQIRKAHPSMAWSAAIKKAGAEYRSGKKTPARKKVSRSAPKKAVRRSAPARRVSAMTGSSDVSGQTLAGVRSAATKLLETKYGQLAVRKMKEKGIRAKKKLSKQMADIMRQIKQFSKL